MKIEEFFDSENLFVGIRPIEIGYIHFHWAKQCRNIREMGWWVKQWRRWCVLGRTTGRRKSKGRFGSLKTSKVIFHRRHKLLDCMNLWTILVGLQEDAALQNPPPPLSPPHMVVMKDYCSHPTTLISILDPLRMSGKLLSCSSSTSPSTSWSKIKFELESQWIHELTTHGFVICYFSTSNPLIWALEFVIYSFYVSEFTNLIPK